VTGWRPATQWQEVNWVSGGKAGHYFRGQLAENLFVFSSKKISRAENLLYLTSRNVGRASILCREQSGRSCCEHETTLVC
jgi:hypothetical protein